MREGETLFETDDDRDEMILETERGGRDGDRGR